MVRPLPWVFPYVTEVNVEDHPLGRTVLRPLVEVRVVGPGGPSNRHAALVDSGSDYTLAAPIVALEAAIDIAAGRSTTVRVGGASREISVVETSMRLCDPSFVGVEGGCEEDNSLSWKAEVGFFSRWDDPPFNVILGQVGFFDHFSVSLSRHSQLAVVDEIDHLEPYADHETPPDG